MMTLDIDVFTVCKLLKSDISTEKIPIILISGRDDDAEIIKGLNSGATDYLSKPFHYPLALSRIQSAIKIRQLEFEIARLKAI